MKILVLVAGTNDPSNADMLSEAFMEGIKKVAEMQTEKIRLKDIELQHFSLPCYAPGAEQGGHFQRIQALVNECCGVVIATPIWNFSVPAHLKNLIDRMGCFALDESRSVGQLHGKPFYLIYTGGTPMTAWPLQRRTTSHVPVSIRYFGGTIIGKHYEPRCTLGRGKFGLVVDKRPESLAAMRGKGEAFAIIAKRYGETGKLPFKEVLLKTLAGWGQQVKKRLGI